MGSGTTPNYGLIKQSLGNTTVWGNEVNGNWESIDALIKAVNDKLGSGTSPVALCYPVGSIYMSVLDTNPATLLNVGTWERIAEGRAIVGVGTADGLAWAANEAKGAAKATLTTANLPAHTHGAGTLDTNSTGGHNHGAGSLTTSTEIPTDPDQKLVTQKTISESTGETFQFNTGVNQDISNAINQHTHSISGNTATAGAHSHSITGATASVGNAQPVDIVQPSFAIYIWKRTA